MSTTSSMKMETDQVGFVSQNRGRLADLSRTLMSTTSSMRMEVVVITIGCEVPHWHHQSSLVTGSQSVAYSSKWPYLTVGTKHTKFPLVWIHCPGHTGV